MVRTKIAQILSPTRVVLASGAEQGVREGMEFVIYELSDPVIDPETKEPLGQLELHKGRVRVIHVQDRIATAITLPRKVFRSGFGFPILDLKRAMEGRWIEEPEDLPIDKSVGIAERPPLTVRVGDLVRSVA